MSDAQVWLGKLAPKDAERDATHVAVVPMIATEELGPGEHVGLVDDNDKKKAGTDTRQLIGIVDPFLAAKVKPGQLFYLCLYPRTVTGLRHVYVHPVLDGDSAAISKDWIAKWGASQGIQYEDLMFHAKMWVETHDGKYGGEYWVEGGRFEGQTLPAVFWEHYDRVSGTNTPENMRRPFFSCSC